MSPQLINSDCLEYMESLSENSFNSIITDPPYEEDFQDKFGTNKQLENLRPNSYSKLNFDSINLNRDKLCAEFSRICSGWVIVFSSPEGVGRWQDAYERAGIKWDTPLAWVKPDAAPRFNGQGAGRGYECICTGWAGKGVRKWNGGGSVGVFYENTRSRSRTGLHPTEKPVPLMRKLIKLYTNEDDSVLDPFMGIGTTGIAALSMNRRFSGCEINDEYFSICEQRINNITNINNLTEKTQLSLI